jgi:hypothetical protein
MKNDLIVFITVIIFLVLATPWYIPISVEPLLFGLPLWSIIVPIILLVLGYFIYFMMGKIKED